MSTNYHCYQRKSDTNDSLFVLELQKVRYHAFSSDWQNNWIMEKSISQRFPLMCGCVCVCVVWPDFTLTRVPQECASQNSVWSFRIKMQIWACWWFRDLCAKGISFITRTGHTLTHINSRGLAAAAGWFCACVNGACMLNLVQGRRRSRHD